MDKENIPIERQISKLIKSTNCTFRLRGDVLNVIIDEISIYPNYTQGDFGEWNVRYGGNAQLAVCVDEINKGCAKLYNTKLYNIEGYAKIENNTVVDIDKTISVYQRY